MTSASVTRNCIAAILAQPSPSEETNYIVQVVDLKQRDDRKNLYTFISNDGCQKLQSHLPSKMAGDVASGKLQNLGLICIKNYVCNRISNDKSALIVTDAEIVSPALDSELDFSKVKEDLPATVQPIKLERKSGNVIPMSASQIVQQQRGGASPATRMGISRRVYPLVSLNPYQGNWTIKVRVTSKGPMRAYKNARGDGNVFSVELTDEEGTQIQATMFREAADKFYSKLDLGKVYYISKGSLRVANKQFSSVRNDYEMTLNANAEIEEVADEVAKIPEIACNVVKIDELGPYVNGRDLVDVIGVVQSVSPVLSIRRKSNNEEIPKRDITIADQSKKTVVISLWNELAKNDGEKLLDMVDESPVVLIKGLRASEFQGVSLSTTSKSVVLVNPDVPEAHNLRTWFKSEGKDAQLTSAGASLPGGTNRNASRSLFEGRESLSEITRPSVGEGKPAYFNIKAYISFIKPDQAMWYLACETCNRKVVEDLSSSKYWCEGCQKHFDDCKRRYIMAVKVSDFSGEAWFSVFNEQVEQLLGHTADRLAEIRAEDESGKSYQAELRKPMWYPYVFRVSVAQSEYMNEKRQRITVRSLSTVDWASESKYLLEQITKITSGN